MLHILCMLFPMFFLLRIEPSKLLFQVYLKFFTSWLLLLYNFELLFYLGSMLFRVRIIVGAIGLSACIVFL